MVDLNKLDLVCVTWHDAHTECETWCKITDIDDSPVIVRTAGWLLPGVKQDHIAVVQSFTDDDSLDAVLCIPVGMVRAVVVCVPAVRTA